MINAPSLLPKTSKRTKKQVIYFWSDCSSVASYITFVEYTFSLKAIRFEIYLRFRKKNIFFSFLSNSNKITCSVRTVPLL